MDKSKWIYCPVCGNKTRLRIREDTELKNFPLFCPKCKLTHIIDVEKLEIVIKNTEKQTFII
ncbi:MAG TPA: cysteine-rich KTR domain-containing protein [Candidatus Faecicola pullistercoris]|nr:cysteine-rich KTR domain-containing protein [Candidatus Faecicola pullistercoris]